MSQSAETQSWIWKRKGFEEVRIIFFSDACSVQFSHSVMSNSLQPHGLQLPCPSPTPRAYSNSCPSRRWYHPTISSSVIPFSCLQSFPASGPVPVSQFFTSSGQRTFSFSISPSSECSGLISFRIDWFDLLAVQSTLKFSNITVQKHQFFSAQPSLWSNSHIQPNVTMDVSIHISHINKWQNMALARWTFLGKVMSLVLNMLSRLAIAFLWRSKHLLVS